MLVVVVMVCEKMTQNQNEPKIFTQISQGRWDFFPDLELEQALFMLKICLLEIQQMSLII